MNNSASTLIIPVETQVREMDAKILLSCIAAERGFPVIMGSRAFVHFQAVEGHNGGTMPSSEPHACLGRPLPCLPQSCPTGVRFPKRSNYICTLPKRSPD